MQFESIADRRVWSKARRIIGKKDRKLAMIARRVGYLRIPLHDNYYEALIRSIVSQQISWAAANAILRKLESLYGGRLPTPGQFLRTRMDRIRSAGISPQKYSYIKDLAQKIEDGHVELAKFGKMADDDIVEELDDVKGIGRWTAEMFLMFSLGRTDVWPVDDLGIRHAVMRVYNLRKEPDRVRMVQIGEKWRPYRSIAALYLWHSHDNSKAKKLRKKEMIA
ncbi:MAG: DNA-3-methyladenine glycosylase [Candidatus Micrarchaeales archaeon]|nr:DNA-3-methyladenine glycosylase [Candidatus Micrarchaeales archaeon]